MLWLEAVKRCCPEQSEKGHEIFRVSHLPRAILLVYSGGAVGSINTKHGSARHTKESPPCVIRYRHSLIKVLRYTRFGKKKYEKIKQYF